MVWPPWMLYVCLPCVCTSGRSSVIIFPPHLDFGSNGVLATAIMYAALQVINVPDDTPPTFGH